MTSTVGIGISEDHQELAATVRRWAADRCPPADARIPLDGDAEDLPGWWGELAELGWLGLHVPEAHGGSGYGLAELVVVLEELGHAGARGPALPTVIVSAALARYGSPDAAGALLGSLASGEAIGGFAFAGDGEWRSDDVGGGTVTGDWPLTIGGGLATHVLVPAGEDADGFELWVVLDVADCDVDPKPGVDRTRRPAGIGANGIAVGADRLLRCPAGSAGIRGIAGVLAAAESVGSATWSVDTAAEYAAVREQFGRPIGQFQAVKHRCADMLARSALARAAVWDAAAGLDRSVESGPLSAATAAALGLEGAYRCAKDCIQVLGGIGFTWEHDAHIHLKRSMADRVAFGDEAWWRAEIAALVHAGIRHRVHIELPPEAEPIRTEVTAFLGDLQTHPKPEWNRRVAEAGYLVPHWPKPWGRDASALEQLVVDEEFRRARVRRPHLAVGAWALPTIIVHGTREQQERFILPTLRQELTWCQMFSEPGAGSDLASLTTKAVRVDGGWSLTGQKVWTSMAHFADFGICLARTDPDAPKHDGIGCFLVDMRSDGLDIRPLKELTGAEMFNEVFLEDVFVPDDCVVGAPTAGWQAARTTLGNERVSMGAGSSFGPSLEAVFDLADRTNAFDDPIHAAGIAEIVATTLALAALGARMTLQSLAGASPTAEASIRKLIGVENDQRVQEVALELLGPLGATGDGESELWVGGFLGNRSLSIAGGTSEIQRNVIAERLLGLPRDP